MRYRGRFAPSPTGPLHAGSLVSAVASYCEARSRKGHWLLRIEDLDPPREIKGAADSIISTLDKFGFEWDEPILFQSRRTEIYQEVIARLNNSDQTYICNCSRSTVKVTGTQSAFGVRYAGTCRGKTVTNRQVSSIRIKTPDKVIQFNDRIQGYYQQNLQQDIGDFIIKRADGQIAYQLAVVVDDALQNITDIVRGSDLLDSTPRQIFLQDQLHYSQPGYAHIPVIVNKLHEKLSKQTCAKPVDAANASVTLFQSLCYLGQNPPESLHGAPVREIWDWAINNWQLDHVVKSDSILEIDPI